MKIVQHNHYKRVVKATVLAFVFILTGLPGNLYFGKEIVPEVKAETSLNNPRIVADSSMNSGQKVTWDCVWFGSYPQTEIVNEPGTSGVFGKRWVAKTDYLVDKTLYNNLNTSNGWFENEIIVNGSKYKRIKGEDIDYLNSGLTDSNDNNYYYYSNKNSYHYFKYEKIKWRILKITDNRAMLLADKTIDDYPYNEKHVETTWKNCTIRSWLNGNSGDSFFNKAFNSEEKGVINSTNLSNYHSGPYSEIDENIDTTDRIFLLSSYEVYDSEKSSSFGFNNSYLTGDEGRRCKSTTYAKARGLYSPQGFCWWWLRSPGMDHKNFARIIENGSIDYYGYNSYNHQDGVRPVLTLNLSDTSMWSYAGTVCSDGNVNEEEESPDQFNGRLDTETDQYIVEEVKKYTSDELYAQYNAIFKSSCSDEEKFKRYSELFSDKCGITDVREGISYLSQATPERYKYLFLTTNDAFCAYNYWNWLFTDPVGNIARADLYAAGLIFNSEYKEYVNFKTISTNEYPGVKKNKALLKEFMMLDQDTLVSDAVNNVNSETKFLKNLLKLNDIKETDELDYIMDQIMKTSDPSKRKKLQTQFTDKIINAVKANGSNTVYLEGDQFGKAMNHASAILGFAGATANDIVALMNLNNDIQTYNKYKDFLETIYQNKDVSFEMRFAAYQILDDIENGYYNKTISILANVIDFEKEMMFLDKGMLETYLENNHISTSGLGLFADATATISLATFVSNIVVDTGDLVKQIAYTQGYAELSALYALKLADDKKAFLQNQTPENAWKFFEDYTILWNLRYEGEKQYQDMSTVKMFIFAKVKTFKYEEKNAVVNDTILQLVKNRFELRGHIVPESVSYIRKAVVACPVDVKVYNSSGNLVADMKDGKETDITNSYGRFAVVFDPYKEEYSKVICQKTNDFLKIELTAVSDGLVDYKECKGDSIELFNNQDVQTGDKIKIGDDGYEVELKDSAEIEKHNFVSNKGNTFVNAEDVVWGVDRIEIQKGETKALEVTIVPENATNALLQWYSDDENIATVKNGQIKGMQTGETNIYVKICDSNKISEKIPVIVTGKTDEVETYPISYDLNGGKVNDNSTSYTVETKTFTLKNPVREGYQFIGWTGSNGNTPQTTVTISKGTTGNLSYKANWKKTDTSEKNTETKPAKESGGTTENRPNQAIVNSIKLSGISKKIAAGKKVKISAAVLPENASNKKLKWTTSNKKVATVNQSGIVAVKKKTGGKSVKIIATALDGSGKKAVWNIKVMKGSVAKITVNGSKPTLKVGKTLKLKAAVKATKGANKKLKWISSNPEAATVNGKGVVKALKAGKGKIVKITVIATDGSNKKKTVKLKIK